MWEREGRGRRSNFSIERVAPAIMMRLTTAQSADNSIFGGKGGSKFSPTTRHNNACSIPILYPSHPLGLLQCGGSARRGIEGRGWVERSSCFYGLAVKTGSIALRKICCCCCCVCFVLFFLVWLKKLVFWGRNIFFPICLKKNGTP